MRLLLGLAGLCLALLIISDGLANWAVETGSSWELRLAPGDSRALAAAAGEHLAHATTPADLQAASDLARRALAVGVTQVDALRDLGLIADRKGDGARARAVMSLAGQRSPLDGVTHLWLLAHRLDAGDYGEAFADADILLRHAPGLASRLTPVLVAYAAPGRAALTARLADDPPWRPDVLMALAAQAPDPAVVQAILSGLQETAGKPTPSEWSAYLDRRIRDQAYGVAYLDWLRVLPPTALAQAKSIYDGDFSGLPGPAPFNWRLGGGLGGQADIDHRDGGPGGVLHASYDGYGAPDLAEQLLVLAPGSYRFSGQARASGDAAQAMAWTLVCAEAPRARLAQVPAPGDPGDWRSFSTAVQIPTTGCAAQWLRLTPLPVDHPRPLEVWYRGLAMARAG